MKRHVAITFGATFLLGVLIFLPVGHAQDANPFCATVPRQQWISAEEVGSRLRRAGYELVRLRMADDKCYGALVRDTAGHTHDLVVHPVTAEIMR